MTTRGVGESWPLANQNLANEEIEINSDQLRTEAQRMLEATIQHPEAIRFTFLRIMAMIEREGFQIPQDGMEFLVSNEPLKRMS
ncbi:hypothetical protein [Sulfitobacter sp.]|uniref:hypothetical protein n=1 Tax=Sulfitobacter sp. TaxID=1903071 RepID=UPI003EF5A76F